jgi:hypothetical protein
VSVRLIREIHAELLRGVRGGRLQPGELRTNLLVSFDFARMWSGLGRRGAVMARTSGKT